MKEHALFPTLVCEFEYDQSDNFKKILFDKILGFIDPEGRSDEITGHVILHHEPAFDRLFAFATKSVEQYVSRLHIDTSLFDFNLTKTWFNLKDESVTPLHAHRDSHVSFSYYANIPDNKNHNIRFHDEHKHEPYAGSIRWNNTSQTWDELNALTWSINPIEGHLLVFPSSLMHDTTGIANSVDTFHNLDKLKNSRICIAGDILLTYKEKTASPLGIQPLKNWRRYNDV
jgi:Putative 2OG-Fe(II) oxygenase